MLKAVALMILIPVVILAVLIVSNKKNAIVTGITNYVGCQIRQGELVKDSSQKTAKCRVRYPDGGTACTSSAQCKGFCVSEDVRDIGITGVCQDTSDTNGCYKTGMLDKTCCLTDGVEECWNR